MDLIETLVNNVTVLSYRNLPHAVVDNAKKFILDTIGVGLAGRNAPGIPQLREILERRGGAQEATGIGLKRKLPATSAALLNGATFHALDYDDTLDESALHAYTSVLPAALATSEFVGQISGKDLLLATVLGVDTICRLGIALKTAVRFIRTSTCGYFGATMAAAKLLRLDARQTWNACGIVYSRVAGSVQCQLDGGLVKRMHPGFAAESGVLSGLMADKNITGALSVLEGPYGYYNLYEGGKYTREAVLTGLGTEFTGQRLSIKPYPSCRMTHSSIYGCLRLREKYDLEAEEIDSVNIRASKMVKEMVGRPFDIKQNPQVEAQFSIPYTSAVALLKGSVNIDDFECEKVMRSERARLAQRIEVILDENLPENAILTANIDLTTKTGNVLSQRVDIPKGHPENEMTMDEVIDKFTDCCEYAGIPVIQSSALVDTVLKLESIHSIDELTKHLRLHETQ